MDSTNQGPENDVRNALFQRLMQDKGEKIENKEEFKIAFEILKRFRSAMVGFRGEIEDMVMMLDEVDDCFFQNY